MSQSRLVTLISLAVALLGILAAVDWSAFALAPWPVRLGILGSVLGSIGAALGKALGGGDSNPPAAS